MSWSFDERLAYERSQRKLVDSFWLSWFGPDVAIEVVTDLAEQRRGIDARVLPGVPPSPLAGVAFAVTAQEKIRSKDYGDILLESVSNDVRRTPGWTHTIAADVVLYAIAATRRALLLPGPALRLLFAKRECDWKRRFGLRAAQNPSYRTLNVPVPLDVIVPAIDREHGRVHCSRCDRSCVWSEARGGASVVGCVGCLRLGPSPWAIPASALVLSAPTDARSTADATRPTPRAVRT